MTTELLEAPTIWELVRRRAEVSTGRIMLLDAHGRRVTFDELATLAERTAAGLLAQGIGPDDAMSVGVCVHGAAADALVAQGVGPLGLTASELAPAARRLLNDATRA